MSAFVIGERILPCCDHQSIKVTPESDGSFRKCGVCRRKYQVVFEPASDHVRQLLDIPDLQRFTLVES